MAQFTEEYEHHRDEVEEVEDYADPDGCPAHLIFDDLVFHEGRLKEHHVGDANESNLVELLEEVVPAVVMRP